MTDWRNLIFSPLDLPDPPEVDMEEFLKWHADQKAFMLEHNTNRIKSSKIYGGYGWIISWAMWWNTYKLDNPWICDFDKRFPELVEYINLFPFKQLKSISFLNQKGGAEVNPHSDPDRMWGMRFYLKNKTKDALYFSRMKEPNDFRINTMEDENGNPVTEKKNHLEFCKDEKIYARFPKDECAWMLNSYRAWHGLDKNSSPTGSRITVAIIGEYDENKLYKLLENSTQKYNNYQIWWDK